MEKTERIILGIDPGNNTDHALAAVYSVRLNSVGTDVLINRLADLPATADNMGVALVGCIAVLIEIPVWVLVILVVTIPVGVVAVGITPLTVFLVKKAVGFFADIAILKRHSAALADQILG